jgi:hypothetical protein
MNQPLFCKPDDWTSVEDSLIGLEAPTIGSSKKIGCGGDAWITEPGYGGEGGIRRLECPCTALLGLVRMQQRKHLSDFRLLPDHIDVF